MHDSAVEAELRREVRRARAEGTIASRVAMAGEPRLEDRWRRLGLLHAGLPESLGGAGAIRRSPSSWRRSAPATCSRPAPS